MRKNCVNLITRRLIVPYHNHEKGILLLLYSDHVSPKPPFSSLGFNSTWVQSSHPFSSIPKSYNSVQLEKSGLVKTVNDLDDALNLFQEMVHTTPRPPILEFNKLLGIIVKMNHYKTVIMLIKEMVCLLQIPVTCITMNIAINCCCHLLRIDSGFAFFGYFLKCGFEADVWTYNALLKGLVLEDRVIEAQMLFKKLIRDKICEPDQVTYGTVINGLCKSGNTTIAIRLLRFMEQRGGCRPHSMIIDGLCKDKMINDALDLLSEMIDKGIYPDVVTYTCLIQGLCNLGRTEDAKQMLREMKNRNACPNVHTFSILVDAFCKQGKMEDAKNVLRIMNESGLYPNVVTYSALINGYCLQGRMEEGTEVFNTMISKGIEPNIITFNSLIKGHCKKSNIDEAMRVFGEISRMKLEPNVATYTTMLQGLLSVGSCEAARELFQQMQAVGQTPNLVTYTILLDGLCKNNEIDEALSYFRSMLENGLRPDVAIYNVLIDATAKNKKLGIARDLFNELYSRGLQPDVKTYTCMIGGLCHEGLIEEARELLTEMVKNADRRGFSIDSSSFSMLLHSLPAKELQDPTLINLIEKLVPRDIKKPMPYF